MFSLLKRIGARTTKRIGIYSLTPCCGTTHISLSIANYFASKKRNSVLYIECRSDDSDGSPSNIKKSQYNTLSEGIIRLRTNKTISVCGISGFEKFGVHYIPSCKPYEAKRLISEKYDIIISEQRIWDNEFFQPNGVYDKHIYTFCAKPWRYLDMQLNLKQIISLKSGIPQGEYCSFGLTKPEKKMIKEEFNLHSICIPFIDDPFCLNNQDLNFLEMLLIKRR